jgi:hypothetical protein
MGKETKSHPKKTTFGIREKISKHSRTIGAKTMIKEDNRQIESKTETLKEINEPSLQADPESKLLFKKYE